MPMISNRDYRALHAAEPTAPKPSKNSRLRALAEESADQLKRAEVLQNWRIEWDELQISWDEELAACRTDTDRIAVNLAYERACASLARRKPK